MRQPFGQTLVAGDSWNWTLPLERAAASGSTPKYFFRGPSAQTLDLAGTLAADGVSFQFSATSAQTLTLVGELAWQLCLFDASGNRTELERGTVTVLPDIQSVEAGASFDGRSWVKRTLDAVQSVIQGRASRVEKQYEIAGRRIELIPLDELLKLEGDLQSKYDRELVANGLKRPGGNQIKVRFGRGDGRFGEWH